MFLVYSRTELMRKIKQNTQDLKSETPKILCKFTRAELVFSNPFIVL